MQVEQLAGRRREGGWVGQQLLDLRPQSPDCALVDEQASTLGDLGAELATVLIAEVPQLSLQVDKGHGGALAGAAWAGDWWSEVVDQATHRLLGFPVGR